MTDDDDAPHWRCTSIVDPFEKIQEQEQQNDEKQRRIKDREHGVARNMKDVEKTTSILPDDDDETMTTGSLSDLHSDFVPSCLLGREEEWKILHEAFLRQTKATTATTEGKNPQLILITGPSGTGKTALIKQFLYSIQKQEEEKCFYGTGKFDLLDASSNKSKQKQQQQQPFVPFVQAMNEFIHQLKPSDIRYFQAKINQHQQQQHSANKTPLDVDLLLDNIPDLTLLFNSDNQQFQNQIFSRLDYSTEEEGGRTTIIGHDAKHNTNHLTALLSTNNQTETRGAGRRRRSSVMRRSIADIEQDLYLLDENSSYFSPTKPYENQQAAGVVKQPLSDVHRKRFLRALSHLLEILFLTKINDYNNDNNNTTQEEAENGNQTEQHSPHCHFLLFLDDLQWADKPSLELLHHLVLLQRQQQRHPGGNSGGGSLVIMGACRGNEVTVQDDLSFMLRSLEEPKNNTQIVEISLSNWTIQQTNQYIASQLLLYTQDQQDMNQDHQHQDQQDFQTLSAMIYRQTKGNIFFVRQCLSNLMNRGIIYPQSYDDDGDGSNNHNNDDEQQQQQQQQYHRQRYRWNVESVQQYLTNNETVIELISFDLQQSYSATPHNLELLKISSCLGATFEEQLLQWILHDLTPDIPSSALISHFIEKEIWIRKQQKQQQQTTHQEQANEQASQQEQTEQQQENKNEGIISFRHDQIQLACYNLIPQSNRGKFHLNLGERLKHILTIKDEEEPHNLIWDRYLFVLASQFVRGLDEIDSNDQVYETALLCLQAGEKAVSLASFGTASAYINAGIKCLGSRTFESTSSSTTSNTKTTKTTNTTNSKFYSLSLALYNAGAEIAHCNGEYEYMEYLVGQVLENAKSPRDTIQVYSTQIVSLGSRNRLQEAIETGFRVLRLLGEAVPSSKTLLLNGAMEFIKTKRMLRSFSAEDILSLPPMKDQDKIMAMKILDLIFIYAFLGKPECAPFVGCRMVRLTLKHGLNVLSGAGFVLFGVLLCSGGFVGNKNEAYKCGQIGIQIVNKYQNIYLCPRVLCAFNGIILPWREPITRSLQPLKETFLSAQQVGDFEMAAVSAFMYTLQSYFAGMSIHHQLDEAKNFLQFMISYQLDTLSFMLSPVVQFLVNISGQNATSNPLDLNGEYLDEDKLVRECREANNHGAIYVLESRRLFLAFHAGRYERVEQICKNIRKLNPRSRPNLSLANFLHMESTAALALYRFEQEQQQQQSDSKNFAPTTRSVRRQRRRLALARRALKTLRGFAEEASCNFMYFVYFLEAELDACQIRWRRKRRLTDAISQYRLAIVFAEREGVVHRHALFTERMAETFQSQGKHADAIRCFEEARDLYASWGGAICVNRLNDTLHKMEWDHSTE